jgi:dihydropteroate synthase
MTARLIDFTLPAGTQIYLRPDPILWPAPLGALPLAGGPGGFETAELLIREPAKRDHPASLRASVATIRQWAEEQGGPTAASVALALERLSAHRPSFASLPAGRPLVMGIVNVTPDSFSDGGDHADAASAIAHGKALIAAGADLLDIGGESTRPGSHPVPEAEEIARVVPVIEGLAGLGVPLSIDTSKAAVMARAVAAGATIINDVRALTAEPRALDVAAASGAAVVLMHCLGEPKTMQQAPAYAHVSLDIFDYLAERIAACEAAGIARAKIAIDPGIGFGKTLDHNLQVLRDLALYQSLGCPLLLGVSRKSFIGRLSGERSGGSPPQPKARLAGSIAAALAGLESGANLLRVHDVAETVQAVAVWRALHGAATSG